MSNQSQINEKTKQQVRERAKFLCEDCHASEQWQYVQFTIDHVIPLTKGGADNLDNLALACFHCNRQKSDKIEALDPETQQIVALFNPRQNQWSQHFIWSTNRLLLLGVTPIGRATVITLNCNRDRLINIRMADLEVGRHPPVNDPILMI
ncbi:HNH endonuclease [Oscillatoriales cyanobacterium USR001]|nr:HNH endonuclease [Oscillatoriales cyanobacterium USR001]